MSRVDYDQIAHLYDEPIRDHVVDERLLSFLAERPEASIACARRWLTRATTPRSSRKSA